MRIPKDNRQLEQARRLRREMSPQKRHLWYDFLRYYPVKIYKQRIIGNYIVDFYCACAQLVIEIDKPVSIPDGFAEKLRTRDAFLRSLGLTVLHFSSEEINLNIDASCHAIDRHISRCMMRKPPVST